MSYIMNSLIAYDTTTGEIAGYLARNRGLPAASEIAEYVAVSHGLTGSMNTYDADDFDSEGNMTATALEKYDIDSDLKLKIAKDIQPLPTTSYDRVAVNGDGKLTHFFSGPIPQNYQCSISAIVTDIYGDPLDEDSVTGYPIIAADSTAVAMISLQKYDHTGVPTSSSGEWFSVSTTGGRISYRRIQLDANGQAVIYLTASAEEKLITITFDNYYPGALPLTPRTVGTETTIYCGDDDAPLPVI